MWEELLTNPRVQGAIAFVLAAIIAWLFKVVVDHKKLLKVIAALCALIFAEEDKNLSNAKKNKEVSEAFKKSVDDETIKTTKKKFGTIENAVHWTYQKVAKPLVKTGIVGLIDRIR